MKILIEQEVDPKFLECVISPRYLEDTKFSVGGHGFESDNEQGKLAIRHLSEFYYDGDYKDTSFNENNYAGLYLKLIILIDEGRVLHWPEGVRASFHYKSCDENDFVLYDGAGKEIASLYDKHGYSYVIGPKFMNEYDDYFVMEVDETGHIVGYDRDALVKDLETRFNRQQD